MFRIRSRHAALAIPLRRRAPALFPLSRQGRYRLARLADRYGSEIALTKLLTLLSADCRWQGPSRPNVFERCGVCLPDLVARPRADVPP